MYASIQLLWVAIIQQHFATLVPRTPRVSGGRMCGGRSPPLSRGSSCRSQLMHRVAIISQSCGIASSTQLPRMQPYACAVA